MMVPGLRMASTFFSRAALDIEVLDHGLDDPVHFGQLLQVIFEVADRDQARQRGSMKAAGFDFLRRLEPGGGDLVARRPFRARRNNVEQIAGNTGVGEVGGDARAHGSGAQNCDFMNHFHEDIAPLFSTDSRTVEYQ